MEEIRYIAFKCINSTHDRNAPLLNYLSKKVFAIKDLFSYLICYLNCSN